jgi:hypothetical protein
MDPVGVQPWEPAEAQRLHWLPLSVRYKLDLLGLRLRLAQWQALAYEDREALVAADMNTPARQQELRRVLLRAGATEDEPVHHPDGGFEAYLARKRAV